MHTKHHEWTVRWIPGPLGFGLEYWGPVERHPAYAATVRAVGEDWSTQRWQITWNMIMELINSAGALEYKVSRLRSLLEEVQVWAETSVERPPAEEPWPEFGHGVGHESLTWFAWEYRDALAWARSFDDRLRLTPPGRLARFGDIGLVPSLNPEHPVTPEVLRVWERFHGTEAVTDMRNQTGLALHVSSIHRPGAGAPLVCICQAAATSSAVGSARKRHDRG